VGPDDVRLVGFAERASVERAQAWVDDWPSRPGAVEVGVGDAAGRLPAAPLLAAQSLPPADRACRDGYAVRSEETAGASAYDPLLLRLAEAARTAGPGHADLVAAGVAMPPGADAVLSFDAALAVGQTLEVIAATAGEAGVERAGQQLVAGAPLLGLGQAIRPHQAGLLAAAGVERLLVLDRPRVRVLLAGAKPIAGLAVGDAHGPMLRALIERDGGLAEVRQAGPDLRRALRSAALEPGAELLIATGRTGTGPDDEAPLALAELGRLELHGLALRPGGSAGLGAVGDRPVLLLPGDPLACLVAYELLAGRLVRRLGGRAPELPHPRREAELARKLVSAVGLLEVCQVRLVEGRAVPLGVTESGGLSAAARADGFVLVPASLEGFAAGALVTIHLY
jgi:molybdopterin molybdotransferase